MRGRRYRGRYPPAIRTLLHHLLLERGQSSIYTPLFLDGPSEKKVAKLTNPILLPGPEAWNPGMAKEELKKSEPKVETAAVVSVNPTQPAKSGECSEYSEPIEKWQEERPSDRKGRYGKTKVMYVKKTAVKPNDLGQ